jgi:hypothetical protein
MRSEPNIRLTPFRRVHPSHGGSDHGANWGYFEVTTMGGALLRIISSGSHADQPWEHVSVSLADRTPTLEEMCLVKDLFWSGEETVLQFHPRTSAYVNHHPNCLHLWKRRKQDAELPPAELIGPKRVGAEANTGDRR